MPPPRGQEQEQQNDKFVWPVDPKGHIGSPFGPRGGRMHEGVDIFVASGSQAIAVLPGKATWGDNPGGWGWYVDINHGNGLTTRYAHLKKRYKEGEVNQGDIIGLTGGAAGDPGKGNAQGAHLHFEVLENGVAVDPEGYLTGAKSVDGTAIGGSGPGGGGDSDLAQVESIAKASAFATFLALPGIFQTPESMALRGERSLMNDQALLPFIEQLCQASLRNFQSMPNGDFFAFFPDYFGGLGHRTPYWEIDDIEIIDGRIDLSDDALATHVYVVGDVSAFDGQIDWKDKIQSAGVVTIYNVFAAQADFLNGIPKFAPTDSKEEREEKMDKYEKEMLASDTPRLNDKDAATAFIKKYGARPYFEEAPMVRNPYYEAFLAYQKFMLLWSRQFITTFTVTFMPELFPGGIVAFPRHGIQCYIDEVEHSCSYTDGFTTQVNLSAPAALPGSHRKPNVHRGMIRSQT